MPELTAITRFPVKGLGPDNLESVALTAGRTLPDDRRWAIEHGEPVFDPAAPGHLKKKHFLMLAEQAGLAALNCRYDAATGQLSVRDGSEHAVTVDLDDPATHDPLFDLLRDTLDAEIRGGLRIVSAPGQAMTDIPEPQISLINAATVRDLSEKTGRPIDPVRFRGNLLIDGATAWSELDWVGRTIRIGNIACRVESRIRRCAATSVDPVTARRDIDLPRLIFDTQGHMDCGLYLTVLESGSIRGGDPVNPM